MSAEVLDDLQHFGQRDATISLVLTRANAQPLIQHAASQSKTIPVPSVFVLQYCLFCPAHAVLSRPAVLG